MPRIPDFTTSSGTLYTVRLGARAGVIATCTAASGRTIVLDILESWPGPIVFRCDHSDDGRELAQHVAEWFAANTEPLET